MDRENQGIIAKKYAQAFINLFSNMLEFHIPEDIDKIKTFIAYLRDHRKSLLYADLKLLDQYKRQQILHNLIDKFELKAEFKKLTDLLIIHQRIFLLEDVLTLIIDLYLTHINVIPFTLFLSHDLSSEQEHNLRNFLEMKSHKKVIIKSQLDRKLIAGIKAISAEYEWEHSIRKMLSSLNQS